ncbi:MAG: class I adenylate-forming enzyme family protein [Candidatus Binatia bacterium]
MQENFACFVESNARRFKGKAALVWQDGSLTWAELERRASGIARLLAKQGVMPGDRVAMLAPNRWSFPVTFLGVLKLSATAAPLTPLLQKEELAEILGDLRAKRVLGEVKVREDVWVTPRLTNSPALIVYTSGSTGRPKGAVFSHRALTFVNRSWGEPVMGLKLEDVVLGVLPYGHNFGMYGGLLAPLLFGATVALVERFTPEAVFDAIKRHRVTVFPGVPTMFRRLLNSPEFASADLSSLRLTVSGAAPCPWELVKEWRARTGTRILRGYGMTEVPRPISYFADDPTDFPDSIGRAVPGVEVRVVDEAARSLTCGEVGELWIKSPAAMDAYLDAPEETQGVLVDGWFKTGDLASVSSEGFIRIVGRKRERILRGGYSVFPQEVEAVLLSHPAVAEAAVVGVPSPDLGEEVTAFVTLKPMAGTTAEVLISFCKEHLAHFKFPRRVTIVNELPKGTTGKIIKAELIREHF